MTGLFFLWLFTSNWGTTEKSLEEVWYFWCENGMLRNSTCCGWSGWSSGVPWIFERFISHIKNGDAWWCRLWVLSTEGGISAQRMISWFYRNLLICWVFTSPYCWWEPHNILYLVYSFFGLSPQFWTIQFITFWVEGPLLSPLTADIPILFDDILLYPMVFTVFPCPLIIGISPKFIVSGLCCHWILYFCW